MSFFHLAVVAWWCLLSPASSFPSSRVPNSIRCRQLARPQFSKASDTAADIPPSAKSTEGNVGELSSKVALAKKSFRLLQTVGDVILKNNNATEPQEPIFSLENSPIFLKKRYRWTRSPPLKRLTAFAFEVCDKDNTGTIDKEDLYIGVLLIHLNLAKYVGAAACNPPLRDQLYELFDVIDWQKTGYLDIDDFTDIVVVCCAHLTSRICIYYAIILGIIPFLVSRFMMLLRSHNLELLSKWMQRKVLLELAVQETVTFVLFAGAVPWVFNKIDKRSRRLVKPRKKLFTFSHWFRWSNKIKSKPTPTVGENQGKTKQSKPTPSAGEKQGKTKLQSKIEKPKGEEGKSMNRFRFNIPLLRNGSHKEDKPEYQTAVEDAEQKSKSDADAQ